MVAYVAMKTVMEEVRGTIKIQLMKNTWLEMA